MTRTSAMREPTYFVLAALLTSPLHGYAIIKRAEELSGGRVRLATGTLYTALDRLTADGHVRLVSEETVAGRIRRTYGLTEDGATALRGAADGRGGAGRHRRPGADRGRRDRPEAEDGVTGSSALLERFARALLLAYPARYRRERGEEIIATLLEAAPPGRRLPSARDTRALIAGGRHARATGNHGPNARADLRLTLLLGLSMFLMTVPGFGFAGWLSIAAGMLCAAAALAPWLGSRAATLVLVTAAGALEIIVVQAQRPVGVMLVDAAAPLIALGALAALSGGSPRLPRSWAWLPCLFLTSVALATGRLFPTPLHGPLGVAIELLPVAVAVGWLVVDARPLLAVCLCLLLWLLSSGAGMLAQAGPEGPPLLEGLLPPLAVVGGVTLAAGCLFLRQRAVLTTRRRS